MREGVAFLARLTNGLERASQRQLCNPESVVSYLQQPMCLTAKMLYINKRIVL